MPCGMHRYLVRTWLVGKPTRTAGALSAPRSGSGAAASCCAASHLPIPLGGGILHQMQSGCDPSWSGSCRALTGDATMAPCDLVTCGFSPAWCNSREFVQIGVGGADTGMAEPEGDH